MRHSLVGEAAALVIPACSGSVPGLACFRRGGLEPFWGPGFSRRPVSGDRVRRARSGFALSRDEHRAGGLGCLAAPFATALATSIPPPRDGRSERHRGATALCSPRAHGRARAGRLLTQRTIWSSQIGLLLLAPFVALVILLRCGDFWRASIELPGAPSAAKARGLSAEIP